MRVVARLACAVLTLGLVDAASRSLEEDPFCTESCTPATAEACCIFGEPFGYAELEARRSIAASNGALGSIEEVLLGFSSGEAERNEPPELPKELAENVHELAKRVLHWLCDVKLRLARFSNHNVVGAVAKRLHISVRYHVILMMNIVVWSGDEIAGFRYPPPAINGYGPCGGRWPCQRTMTCGRQGCRAQIPFPWPAKPLVLSTLYQPMPQQPLYYYYRPQYNPYLPSASVPRQMPLLNPGPEIPVEITVKKNPSPEEAKNDVSSNGEKPRHKQDGRGKFDNPQKQKPDKTRVHLPENYYAFRQRIRKYADEALSGALSIPADSLLLEDKRNYPSRAILPVRQPPPTRAQQQSFQQGEAAQVDLQRK